jgi:pilus assembly protein CpaE
MSDRAAGDALRVVIVNPDEFTRAMLRRHLHGNGCRVLGDSAEAKAGLRLIRSLQPDLVVLGLGRTAESSVELVRTVRDDLPTVGIVVLSDKADPEAILACMRAGAQEFLTLPLSFPELDRAVERLRRLREQLATPPPRRGRLIAVYPAKGGVGATSVAVNLALALTVHSRRQVALVDFNIHGGDAAFMLDAAGRPSLATIAAGRAPEEEVVKEALSSHRTGLRLLTLFDRPEESRALRKDQVSHLYGVLSGLFEEVVVDTGRHLDGRVRELFDLADELLVVSGLDAATVHATRRTLELFSRMEIDRARIRLVVNRHQDAKISTQDLEEAMRAGVFWSLPNDYRPMTAALEAREPVVLDSPGSRLARSYRAFAGTLCEMLAAADGGKSVARDDASTGSS